MELHVVTALVATAFSFQALAAPSAPADPGWPRVHNRDGNRLVVYQPQVDEWKNFQDLTWRMAVAITPKDGNEVVGVVEMKGKTAVDNDNKVVVITNMEVTGTRFSSENAQQMDQLVRTFNKDTITISLHRLIACVPKPDASPGVQLNNEPPRVFVGYRPSILLSVDGPPVLSEIPKTNLKFVVNTQWPIFFNGENYYFPVGQYWMKAGNIDGKWEPTKDLPSEMSVVAEDNEWSALKAIIPAPKNPEGPIPAVFFSDKPADVILFDGQPEWTRIPETRLQYATNTNSVVFVYAETQQFFFLTGGRWFRADDLKGPWTFAMQDLPADFQKIPASCPASAILASVPGTDEAKDAVLLAQVPTTLTVKPEEAAASVKVEYAGDPKFEPISGTSLTYAANTQDKVIKVGDVYYLCLQGVWFLSPNPNGPWTTASSVPKEIYSIPPSSPVYNVTYVTQTTVPDGTVQSSYTAGYLGAFIVGAATGAIIANGTGYWNAPYCSAPYSYNNAYRYPAYYPRPVPYGGAYGTARYNSATGTYGVSKTAYGPYGSATRGAAYNPYTGTAARGASVSTPNGSRSAAKAYNPYTGTYASTRQGSSPTAQWGSSYVSNGDKSAYGQHYSGDKGSAAKIQGSEGGKAAASSSNWGHSAAAKNSDGDMYAGHNGNVYKNTGDGWQTYDNGSWGDVEKPTPDFSKASGQSQSSSSNRSAQAQEAANSRPNQNSPSVSTRPAQAQPGANTRPNQNSPQMQNSAKTRPTQNPAQAQGSANNRPTKATQQPSSGASNRTGESAQQRSSTQGSRSNGASSSEIQSMQRESQNRQRGAQESSQFQSQRSSGGGSASSRSGGSSGGSRSSSGGGGSRSGGGGGGGRR